MMSELIIYFVYIFLTYAMRRASTYDIVDSK